MGHGSWHRWSGRGRKHPWNNRSLPDDLDLNEDIESQLGGQLRSEGLEKSQDELSVQEPTPANDFDDHPLHEHDNLHAGENFSKGHCLKPVGQVHV